MDVYYLVWLAYLLILIVLKRSRERCMNAQVVVESVVSD